MHAHISVGSQGVIVPDEAGEGVGTGAGVAGGVEDGDDEGIGDGTGDAGGDIPPERASRSAASKKQVSSVHPLSVSESEPQLFPLENFEKSVEGTTKPLLMHPVDAPGVYKHELPVWQLP